MSIIRETITNILSVINVKYMIATAVMIVVFALICHLIFLVIQSIQKRSQAINVKFPLIDDYGEIKDDKQFVVDKELTVELVNPEDDIVDNNVKTDSELFIKTLSIETGKLISSDNVNINMPEVGEIDYNKIKEQRESEIESIRLEREKASIDNLRRLAKADSEEDLNMSSEIDN